MAPAKDPFRSIRALSGPQGWGEGRPGGDPSRGGLEGLEGVGCTSILGRCSNWRGKNSRGGVRTEEFLPRWESLAPASGGAELHTRGPHSYKLISERVLGRSPFSKFKFCLEPISVLGCRFRSPAGEQQHLSKPKGPECSRKGSVPEPLFDLPVLLGTDFCFGVSVPEPDRCATVSVPNREGSKASERVWGRSPFFDLSVLFGTDFCFGVSVSEPDR